MLPPYTSEPDGTLTTSRMLDTPLSDQHAGWFVASPRFWSLLTYGFITYHWASSLGEKDFDQVDGLLSQGEPYYPKYRAAPQTQPRTIDRVSSVVLAGNKYSCVVTEGSSSDPDTDTPLRTITVRYDKGTRTASISCHEVNIQPIVRHTLYRLMLKRLNDFANDPDTVLPILEKLAGLAFQMDIQVGHTSYPHNVSTTVDFPTELPVTFFTSSAYLRSLFKLDETSPADDGCFKITMNHFARSSFFSRKAALTPQETSFQATRQGDSVLLIESDTDVYHFYQMAYRIDTTSIGENKKLRFTLLFSHSREIGIGVVYRSGLFYNPPSDLHILYRAAISRLQTIIRRHFQYINQYNRKANPSHDATSTSTPDVVIPERDVQDRSCVLQ